MLNQGRDYIGAAGILVIMCGLMGLIAGIWTIAVWQWYGTLEHVVGLIMLASALLAIWGSRRFVSKGRNYKMAILLGGVCSVVCGLIFGLMALVLIIISKREFDDLAPALLDN